MKKVDVPSLSLQHIWYPCSQMKDYEELKPMVVKSAFGSYIELDDGTKIIDAISSWWCKSLGHNHPRLKESLLNQLNKFEHVILANTTNDLIARLSAELAALMPGLSKVFYASEGSAAVEIALKMSLHMRKITGDPQRNKFIALKNGYHGETLGALSVSDLPLYSQVYKDILFSTKFIDTVYVDSANNKYWNDASEFWSQVEQQLKPYCETATAIIVEPIVQAAGGMKIYSQNFLSRLAAWAKIHHVHLIADEIMTGIGRTGKMLACEHAKITPDFICLAKGITSGFIPFSAVMTSDEIYNAFYDDYHMNKSFLHSHTHSGNALAASVALATLAVIKDEKLCDRANLLQTYMRDFFTNINTKLNVLANIRGIGAISAVDLVGNEKIRLGYQVFKEAIKLGALIRPLGNTIYWVPPLNINLSTLEKLANITLQALKNVYL